MKRYLSILLQSLCILCISASVAFADLAPYPHRDKTTHDDDDDSCSAQVLQEGAPVGIAARRVVGLAFAGIATRRRED